MWLIKKPFFFSFGNKFLYIVIVHYEWREKGRKNVCWGLLNTMFCPFATTMAKPPPADAKKNVEIKKVTGTWNTRYSGNCMNCMYLWSERENSSDHVVRINANEFAMISLCVRVCRHSMYKYLATHRFGDAMSIIVSVHYTVCTHKNTLYVFNTVFIEFFSFFSIRVYRFRKWFEFSDSMFLLLLLLLCEVSFWEIQAKYDCGEIE